GPRTGRAQGARGAIQAAPVVCREAALRRAPGKRLAARLAALAALASAGAGAGLGLSGCGLSETVDPAAEAARLTQTLRGARIVFTGEVVSPLAPKPFRFSGTGVLSNHPTGAWLHY